MKAHQALPLRGKHQTCAYEHLKTPVMRETLQCNGQTTAACVQPIRLFPLCFAALICVIGLCLSSSAALASAGEAQTCNAQGDKLVNEGKWAAAVTAYTQCSKRHGEQGPVAAWSMFKAQLVLYWHLKDRQAAGAACEAGWKAYNAPELGAPGLEHGYSLCSTLAADGHASGCAAVMSENNPRRMAGRLEPARKSAVGASRV